MEPHKLLAVLARHPFAEELRREHVEKLAECAREMCFARDTVIFPEGDECHEFYLIIKGRVALEMVTPRHTLRVQTLSAGDEFGWSAVLMGGRKHFQARALEPVTALAIDGTELLAACRQDTSLGFALMYRMLGVVSDRLQATRLQLHDMYSPASRFAGN